MSARGLEQLAESMRQEWRERAACVGAFRQGDEFVDVIDPLRARDLIQRYCLACAVVRECRQVADESAPYRLHDYVAGARHYQRHEPREGWAA